MGAKVEKVTVKTPFGELTTTKPGEFSGSNQVLFDLLEKAGVHDAKTVVPQVMNGYIEAATLMNEQFVKDEVIKTGERVIVKLGTSPIRLTTGLNGHDTVRNPSDGKTIDIYGSPILKIGMKVPSKWREEGGRCDVMSKDIEAAFAAKRK